MRFKPTFFITPKVATSLMRIEAAREAVRHLPITPSLPAALRETARLYSMHYSTMAEGSRLPQEQVSYFAYCVNNHADCVRCRASVISAIPPSGGRTATIGHADLKDSPPFDPLAPLFYGQAVNYYGKARP
jgi:hypothetical protein